MPAVAQLVVAHQGGWDELGLVLAPLLLFAWLLWVANRRAARLGAADDGGDDGAEHGAGTREDGRADG